MPVAAMSRMRSPRRTVSARVEPGGRLVEEQHLRVRHAQARAIDTSWRSPWLSSPACRSRSSLEPDAVERRRHLAVAVLAAGAEDRGADVLLDGEVVVELERLERPGRGRVRTRAWAGSRRCGRRRAGRRPSAWAKPVTASITLVLPAPFGPMRPTTCPASTCERDVGDRDHAAVADGEVLDARARSRRRLRRVAARSAATASDATVAAAGTGGSGADRLASSWPPDARPSGCWISVRIRPTPLMTHEPAPEVDPPVRGEEHDARGGE